MRSRVRVIVPDSHGAHIDTSARDAFLADVERLRPDEVVLLGDHLDCGGTFSAHQRTYSNELAESYEDDCEAANEFLDLIQRHAPRADVHYLEGNHEGHVERWAARAFTSRKDAEGLLERYGPPAALQLKQRGIRYYRRSERHGGISTPGTIRLGKCYFTHGISACRHAADYHVRKFGGSIVFGHVHRSQSVIQRTVSADAIGGWCPGTLAKLQPLYRHSDPTDWTHGYAVQFVARSGRFVHVNVPILRGESMLQDVAKRIA